MGNQHTFKRIFLIVMDSVGIGEAPDAKAFGDEGAHTLKHIAEKMNFMLSDSGKRKQWKENCILASKEFCWQNEEKVLTEIYSQFL